MPNRKESNRGSKKDRQSEQVPSLRPSVVALCTADWHLSEKPPPCRQKEADWFEAMRRTVREVFRLQAKHAVPLLVAGDLNDRWDSSPALINFWLEELNSPSRNTLCDIIAIPGNHDLPYHSYKLRRQSAYWTLVEAGRIVNAHPNQPVDRGSIRVHGFPCGYEVRPLKKRHSLVVEIALVHRYIWVCGSEYDGARKQDHFSNVMKQTAGYDAVVFGDNHCRFWSPALRVYNCGCLMRRRSVERRYNTSVGVIRSDGSVRPYRLNQNDDCFEAVEETAPTIDGMDELVHELDGLKGSSADDFREAVVRGVGGSSPKVRRVALEALEAEHG